MKIIKTILLFFIQVFAFPQGNNTNTVLGDKVPKPPVFKLRGDEVNKYDTPTSFNQSLNTLGGGAASPSSATEVSRNNSIQNIPVNTFTGTANVNIPLMSFSQGSLAVPLSLNYNQSQVICHQAASWTGLGWDLAGIPVISRIVRDLPDEGILNNSTGYKGFYFYGHQPSYNSSLTKDKEADYFFLNINGSSQKFMLSPMGMAVFMPMSDIKVEVEYSIKPGQTSGGPIVKIFDRFKATMPDGTQYYFGNDNVEKSAEGEANFINGQFSIVDFVNRNHVLSAWYCYKIQSAYGEEINLQYEPTKYSYYKAANSTTSVAVNNVLSPVTKTINRVLIDGKVIKLISSTKKRLVFNDDLYARSDIDFYSPTIAGRFLKSITLYDLNLSATTKTTIGFNYDYFNCAVTALPPGYTAASIGTTYTRKLKLQKLIFPDNSNYVFSYYNENQDLTSSLSFDVDHWGYGKSQTSSTYGLIANDYLNPNGSNREPNFNEGLKGSLYKMNHSLGSEIEFVYEPHEAANYSAGIGGARIKEIINRDLIRSTEVKNAYFYQMPSGQTSGFLATKPIYNLRALNTRQATSSLYAILIQESGRPVVGYRQVKEQELNSDPALNTGYRIQYYKQNISEEGKIENFSGDGQYLPIWFNLKHDYSLGALEKTEAYNATNALIQKTEMTYGDGNFLQYYQARAFQISSGGPVFSRDYFLNVERFRAKSTITTDYGRTGNAVIPITSTQYLTYKDEMPTSFINTYPGSHENVSQIETTDEDGVSNTQINKIAADYSFYDQTVYICDVEPIGNGQFDTVMCYYQPILNIPVYGDDARGVFELQQRKINYAPVESHAMKNGVTIGANYQSYYSDNDTKLGLPKENFVLKNIPKTNFIQAQVSSGILNKETDYKAPISKNLSYNSVGLPLESKSNLGPTSQLEYYSGGNVLFKQKSNLGKPNEYTTQIDYDQFLFGPSKIIGPNLLAEKREYEIYTGKILKVRDNFDRLQQNYIYQATPQIPNPNLAFDNNLRTKICSAGIISMKVYVSGLIPLSTAQFSLDNGSTWQNANIGNNGFQFNTTITNANVNIQARVANNNSTIINTSYHASCTPNVTWGALSSQTNSPTTCNYNLQVFGLSIDGHAEFSIDNSTWTRALIGQNGIQYILLKGPFGSSQTFYARPADNSGFQISTQILTCP